MKKKNGKLLQQLLKCGKKYNFLRFFIYRGKSFKRNQFFSLLCANIDQKKLNCEKIIFLTYFITNM